MNSQKSPIKAVYLNIILPGLGLAYLGRWGMALLFLLWTPLRWVAGMVLFGFALRLAFPGASWAQPARYIAAYVLWMLVMYDTCKIPYELAEEHNRQLAA